MTQSFRQRLADALLGTKVPDVDIVDLSGVDTSNPYYEENQPVQMSTTVTPQRRGGILPDIARGYNENYNNGFNVNNFGQNKGWAQRIGEGLGTVGRFIDSPWGRGLLAAGINKAMGYDNSLQEGLTAAVGRQNAQTADKVYRQQLRQMGYSDEDLAGINGNITDSIYKNLSQNVWRFRNLDQNSYVKMKTLYDRQLQQGIITPEEYKMNVDALNNQYINSQIQTMQAGNVGVSNQTRNTNMNEQLLPYKQYALQTAPQIAMGNLALRQEILPYDIAYKQTQIENLKNKNTNDKSTIKAINENSATLADIDAGLQLIEQNPGAYTWLKGKIGADAANRLDPKGVATRTQIDNITAVYRKWLTGAQMSDAERKAYERFLPAPTDNAQIVKAKLQGMKNSIERKNQILMQGVNTNQQQTQATNDEGWAF